MYATENQLNTKASDCAIEEVYTNNEIIVNEEFNPNIGYLFYYPYRFTSDPAQLKAVGIRRLSIVPSTHALYYKFCTEYIIDGIEKPYTWDGCIDVIPESNLYSILDLMRVQIREGCRNDINCPKEYILNFNYDKGKLTLTVSNLMDSTERVKFKILDIDGELTKVLNQTVETNNLGIMSEKHVLYNVWDRENIEFHASFSDSNRNFIGLNGDFYSRPSLFYLTSCLNNPGFHIRFTLDGKTPILPRYCRFFVQLCFVLNYKMFKV